MMEKRGHAFGLLLIGGVLCASLSFMGCEKPEERKLGKDLLTPSERMNSKVRDSFLIEARSVEMPSVPAAQSQPAMFGELRDQRTGVTRSTFYSQLLLPATNIDLGAPSDLELDSVVLSIRYGGFYGDTSTVQEFRVHQVLEDMDDIRPSHRDSLERSVTAIGSEQIAPKVGKEVNVQSGSLPPQLRIRLNDNFGTNILDRSGEHELSDNQAFTDFVKGIAISSYTSSLQNGEGAVLNGRVPNNHSRVTLYYRNTAQNDTGKLKLELGGSYFNYVKHSTGGSEMSPKLDSAFSKTQTKSYVLGPGEVATQLRFPDLSSLDDSTKISVNKAILKLPVRYNNSSEFFPTDGLLVLYKDASGEFRLTKDRTEEGGQFIGGAYEEKEKHYALRISRHVEAMIKDKVASNSIYLTTSLPFLSEGEANTVARSVLKGPGSSEPPKLELTYTEY